MTQSKLPLLVVVSGVPGAGKSTVGRVIAEHQDATLLDKDDSLEALTANPLDPESVNRLVGLESSNQSARYAPRDTVEAVFAADVVDAE